MKSVLRTIKDRPLLTAGAGVLLVAVAIAGVAFFQPHKLFIDDRVDEALPMPGPAASESQLQPKQIASADFRSLEHDTSGKAVVTQLVDGSRILSLVDFETSNGPDLRVYLSAGQSDRGFGKEYGQDFVELGKLKGNIGDQNYEVPISVDLTKYRNAVIWCKRFSVGFGVATLNLG